MSKTIATEAIKELTSEVAMTEYYQHSHNTPSHQALACDTDYFSFLELPPDRWFL